VAEQNRGPDRVHAAIETVIRLESARLIAGLARYASGDIGLAEELAQDAVVAALEQWPDGGVPANPGAWLMTVAKRRAVNQFRRNRDLERRYAEIGRDAERTEAGGTAEFDQAVADDIDDDLLRLIFTACHPVLLIRRGMTALDRATDLTAQRGTEPGPYVLQAAIASCHARAFRPEETDWAQITALYGVLAKVMPSPIVELNRAVAVSMTSGPQAALDLVDRLAAEPVLRGYHLLPSVRGDLLMKLGRTAEARAEFERASELTANARERELSERRARAAAADPDPGSDQN